ncbi:Phospholipid-transporting ATPase [Fasciola gigantica]|uniref:Phospholipid-transporting ATPase n=1 Tax=Fasciola gigantica TaxID=46835 RepID=A0A504YIC5_FASGI|nr:Phospholipid-transporting ATPase [Fasciola gigantica]
MTKTSTLQCCRRRQQDTDIRIVQTNHIPEYLTPETDQHAKFCDNAIISSRYTWYNFVPKNLFEQFHNLANVYFALIAIVYVFANPVTSILTNLGPLAAVLIIIMIKDGVDDIMRHRRDRALNHIPVNVLHLDFIKNQTAQWITKKAEDLRVGDVIRCDRGEAFPCDIVLLASSNPSSEVNVTTANLDGETNIKKYFAVAKTQKTYGRVTDENWLFEQSDEQFEELAKQLLVKVECQSPCADLNRFEGRMSSGAWTDGEEQGQEEEIPLDSTNLALRGAKLANTDFVIGLVVYTGKETKLSLNGKQAKRKYSSREARSNVILLTFILSMIVLSVILAIVYAVLTADNNDKMWYMPPARQTRWEFVRSLFRFSILLNNLIPISLVLALEFQQIHIASTISRDRYMYDSSEDLSGRANNAQLADELGQVEFLFSDKTGTLTQNVMQLCTCALINSDASTELYKFSDSHFSYQHVKFCSNAIISSRYTWYNFVPKNLFEQFHNLANVFFALIAIMYVFADPTTSIWTNLGPLVAILALIMIKDGIEDIMRHRRDRALNHIPVNVLHLDFIKNQTAQWITKKAEDLRVGDVIRCDRGEAFPCDIVLLASSNPSSEVNVTTANLDGETNIKKYFAVAKTQKTYERVTDENWLFEQSGEQFEELAKQLLVKVECQSPCADLNRFEGRMSSGAWTDGEKQGQEEEIPLDSTNLALRGAKLANTDFVIGLVVYTGKETKLSLNGNQYKRKYSSREARSNVILLTFILSMIALSLIQTIVYAVLTTDNKDKMWYMPPARQTSYLIPISIVFTIEFQQLYIAFTISSDEHMYDSSEDLSGRANNAQLADELGQDGDLESSDASSFEISENNFRLNMRKWKRNISEPILEPKGQVEHMLTLFSLCHSVEVADNAGGVNTKIKYEQDQMRTNLSKCLRNHHDRLNDPLFIGDVDKEHWLD